MRVLIVLLALPLAACGGGGGGLNSPGSTATSSGGTGSTGTGTSTTTAPYTSTQANMFDVTSTTTFNAVGAMQSIATDANGATLYQGNASTVAAPSGTISYDPRDGVFVLALADTKAGISRNITFQDPAHRTTTDAPGVDRQVPLLTGFNYLSALDSTANLTFFYQRPNTAASFVSLAGFERYQKNDDGSTLSEQGVLVFGAQTTLADTPTTGTAHFDGLFLATMMNQVNFGQNPAVQQWISGTSSVDVDFAKRSLSLALAGSVGAAYVGNSPAAVPDSALAAPSGSTFAAAGTASWASASNAFAGAFASASFTTNGTKNAIDFTSVSAGTSTAGASSIDGTFYGPAVKNIGGNFRITGGIPNQRVDILGGFVGSKK